MAYTMSRPRVEDYAKWKLKFDKGYDSRKAAGVKSWRVFRAEDAPNNLVIIMEWDSLENARKHYESPELRDKMQQAGVVGTVEVAYLEEIT